MTERYESEKQKYTQNRDDLLREQGAIQYQLRHAETRKQGLERRLRKEEPGRIKKTRENTGTTLQIAALAGAPVIVYLAEGFWQRNLAEIFVTLDDTAEAGWRLAQTTAKHVGIGQIAQARKDVLTYLDNVIQSNGTVNAALRTEIEQKYGIQAIDKMEEFAKKYREDVESWNVTINEVIDRTLNLGLNYDQLAEKIIQKITPLKNNKESTDTTRASRFQKARELAGQDYLNDPQLKEKNREAIKVLDGIINQKEELDIHMKHIQDAATQAAQMAETTGEYAKYMKEALTHEGRTHPIRDLYLQLIETQRTIWQNDRIVTEQDATKREKQNTQFTKVEGITESQYGTVDLSLPDLAGAFHAMYIGISAITALIVAVGVSKIGKKIAGTPSKKEWKQTRKSLNELAEEIEKIYEEEENNKTKLKQQEGE